MLACGRLCRTASQRSRSRSSLRPWTEPGISFQIQIRLFLLLCVFGLLLLLFKPNQSKQQKELVVLCQPRICENEKSDLGSGSHLFLLTHQLPIYHLFADHKIWYLLLKIQRNKLKNDQRNSGGTLRQKETKRRQTDSHRQSIIINLHSNLNTKDFVYWKKSSKS